MPNFSKAKKIRYYLALSREFQQQQLYVKAEESLQIALKISPDNPTILVALAKLNLAMGEEDKALRILNRVIRAHPQFRPAYFLRGRIYRKKKLLKRALADFEKALGRSSFDRYVLHHVIPLLFRLGRMETALQQLNRLSSLEGSTAWVAEWESRILIGLGQKEKGLKRLRQALEKYPDNKRLLWLYIREASRYESRPVIMVIEKLKKEIPNLAPLSVEDVERIEFQRSLEQVKNPIELKILKKIVDQGKADRFLTKKYAFLLFRYGEPDEGAQLLTKLFLENPEDFIIRRKLESYFREKHQLDRWSTILKQALKRHPYCKSLFGYLRRAALGKDWLNLCDLDYSSFREQVEKLPSTPYFILDGTYKKLPYYAIEHFVTYLNITDVILSPQDLWNVIQSKRQSNSKTIPFQIEDLQAAYPVWILAIGIYWLFRTHTSWSTFFVPAQFVRQDVAATVNIEDQPVYISLRQILRSTHRLLKIVVRRNRGWEFRWPKEIEPEILANGYSLYSPNQFSFVLSRLKEWIPEWTENKIN